MVILINGGGRVISSNSPDRRIRKLVNAINSYPGIRTIMSCGGHKKPRPFTQVPKNEFYVDFGFTARSPSSKSWQSLNEIACSMCDYTYIGIDEWVKITVFKEKETTIFFRLHGRNVDPNKIADDMVEKQKQVPSDYLKTLIPRKPHGYCPRGRTLTDEEINQILAEDTGDD